MVKRQEFETSLTANKVGRFHSNIESAKESAQALYHLLNKKEAVMIIGTKHGIEGFKRTEFSLRLKSEGQRTDSAAIVGSIDEKGFSYA